MTQWRRPVTSRRKFASVAMCAALGIGLLMLPGCTVARKQVQRRTLVPISSIRPCRKRRRSPGSRRSRSTPRRTPRMPSTIRKIRQSAARTTHPGRSAWSTTLRCGTRTPFIPRSTGRSGSRTNQICRERPGDLASYAEDQPYVLISPYPGLEDPVVASAWGAQLRLDDVNDPRLQAFIDRYAGNGPERGARVARAVWRRSAGDGRWGIGSRGVRENVRSSYDPITLTHHPRTPSSGAINSGPLLRGC